MLPRYYLAAILLFTGALNAASQQVDDSIALSKDNRSLPGQTEKLPFEPLILPALAVPATDVSIKIDGDLSDPAWRYAALASNFAEVQPGNSIEPLVRTDTWITYNERFLYVGFRAYDNPASIRASLRNRDRAFDDDWVGFILDTFGNAAWAYEVFVNPYGIQMDLLRSGNREDESFDLIMYSAGRITEDGYEVEMAIPFGSLRFPNTPEQQWRVTFIRNHPRETRRIYSWAGIDQENACLLCQLGTISGITSVKAGTRLQLIPAAIGVQKGSLVDEENPSSGFENGRFHPELSLNMRYDFTSTVAAEATINPDFSQIESDARQIDVNATFALFYPERRPFFQEGSDLFDTWIDMVYTRSINNPIAATKMTGHFGKTSVAYLSAVDEDTPLLLPLQERSELVRGGRSMSNVLRARRAFGVNSFIGGTITDQRLFDGGQGTTASADFKIQFLKRYNLLAQVAVSDTREPDSEKLSEELENDNFANGKYTTVLDGERFKGYGMFLSLNRNSRHWNFEVNYSGFNPTFRAANGFVTRNDYHNLFMFQMIRFYPKWGFADVISPMFQANRQLDFDGTRREISVRPGLNLELKGQTYVYLGYEVGRELFQGVEFTGLHEWVLDVYSRFSDPLNGGFYVVGGRSIARNEDIPEIGRQLNMGARLIIKPVQRLIVEPSINYATLKNLDTGNPFFEGFILRTSVSFQFRRELSLRLITQYNDFDERLNIEPLLSYQMNPFTIFYIGSTHNYGYFDQPYGTHQTARQFFFKFQYLLRR